MSISESLTEANQTVLDAIAASEGPITMGLLPLSESDGENCIRSVIGFCNGKLERLLNLMRISAPAAACYAVASCTSQACTGGRKFWAPVTNRLEIDIHSPLDREKFSDIYEQTCVRLGVVNPDVGSMAWSHIAPIMAQASILHAWTDGLASGINTTIKTTPIPDLEDPAALDNFSRSLASHIHNMANLKNVILTEVGGIVAHRLISSYVYGRYDILPTHLQAPMREAFASSGTVSTLKSPYVSFSHALGEFELVLPKQPGKFTSHQTHWLINGTQHSVQSENHICESELPMGTVEIQLKELGMEYPDQKFKVTIGLEKAFRIFDERNMREKQVSEDSDITLPPGDYMVVMLPEVSTNDPAFEELVGKYKLLSRLPLRPGSEPLEISQHGRTVTLNCALKTGIYHDGDSGDYVTLGNGQLLHYGPSFGFLTYVPKDQHRGTLKIKIMSDEQTLLEEDQELHSHEEGVYDYSTRLEDALVKCIGGLPPGIHPLELGISTSSSSASRKLWYWNGLERISDSLGFICINAPENIKFRTSKGIKKSTRGCEFLPDYHAPEVVITLDNNVELHIPRAGVQATSYSSEDDWEEGLNSGDSISVRERDSRIIKFHSGGFQQWHIDCSGRELAKLDRTRTQYSISLRSIVAQFGNSGNISAVCENGDKFTLFSYATSLIASPLMHSADHAAKQDIWTTDIPSEDLGDLALELINYTTDPDTPPLLTTLLSGSGLEDETEFDVEICSGITAGIKQLPTKNNNPAQIRLTVTIDTETVDGELLFLNVMHMPQGTEKWINLHCKEPHNTSQLTITSLHSAHEIVEGCSWWNHLWHISDKGLTIDMKEIYEDVPPEKIDSALGTISRIISTKYPTDMFLNSASYLLSLPYRLYRRRAAAGEYDADLWWHNATNEIAEHAASRTSPVVRSFLFASNSHALTHQWDSGTHVIHTDPHNIMACFSLLERVKSIGDRVSYASAHYHLGTHPEELFQSFDNFGKVMTGHDAHFGSFKFNDFLSAMTRKAEAHSEKYSSLEQPPVLSARHLLSAITALNRRSRTLWKASESDDPDHMLHGRVQALTLTHRQLEKSIRNINQSIGYQPSQRLSTYESETIYYPDLPSLDNPQAKQLADLSWALCVTARATAHGKMNLTTFTKLKNQFSADNIAKHPINLVLTFAPELYAYYTALLDFALLKNAQQ